MSLIPAKIPEYEEGQGATFHDTVLGADGCIYGIPFYSRRFARLDPKDDSIVEIGPDLVHDLGFGDATVRYGVLANDGFIYVIQHSSQFMIKVDTNDGENNGLVAAFGVEFPPGFRLPRPRCSGVLGPDGCLYFPFSNHKIVRFDPASGQTTNPFPGKFPIALAGRINIQNDRLVVLPQPPSMSYSDDDEITFNVDLQTLSGNFSRLVDLQKSWKSFEGGVFGRDGHIYFLNYLRQVVRLDPWSGICTFQDTPCQFAEVIEERHYEFGSPCLGSDGCIYWPPEDQERILKYDPYRRSVDFVGTSTPSNFRWSSGVTGGPDGKTYFFPYHGSAKQVLVIDPLGDLKEDFYRRIEGDPFQFGRIFQKEEQDDDSNGSNSTVFDVEAKKFGMDVMLQLLDECIQKNQARFDRAGCPVSLLAALCEDCPLDVIHHLMRKNIGQIKYHLENAASNTMI